MFRLFVQNFMALCGLGKAAVINPGQIPHKMQALISDKFDSPNNIQWVARMWSYEIKFKNKGNVHIINFNIFGNVKSITEEISWEELPQGVVKKISDTQAGTSLKHAFKINDSQKQLFEIRMKKGFVQYKFVFDSQGALLDQNSRNIIA